VWRKKVQPKIWANPHPITQKESQKRKKDLPLRVEFSNEPAGNFDGEAVAVGDVLLQSYYSRQLWRRERLENDTMETKMKKGREKKIPGWEPWCASSAQCRCP
jgi:hypothetical protein